MMQYRRRLAALLKRLREDNSGNFATMTALAAPVAIILAAVAIDSASLYTQRREAQALADLAAITAASNIAHPEAAAIATLKDNGIVRIVLKHGGKVAGVDTGSGVDAVTLDVLRGRYRGEADIAVIERFTAAEKPYNAVKVTLTRTGTQYFSATFSPAPTIVTTAVANAPAEAAFSIGSRLLKLDGGLMNSVLSGLTGSTISLSIMDYEALAKADVDAFAFSEALNSELKLQAGTYSDVGGAEVTAAQIATVLAGIDGTDREATLAAKSFARSTVALEKRIRIDRLLSLGRAAGLPIGHPPKGMAASVSARDLLTASAALANGTNQARLDLGTSIPGLLSATVELAIGEPPQQSPWFTVGETGDVVRTAQTRLKVVAEVKGPGGLIGSSIKLPLYVEVAFAEGTLGAVDCSPKRRVEVAARPGVVEARIAEVGNLTNFSRDPGFAPAKIVQAPAVTVTGSADVQVANLKAKTLSFSDVDIEGRTIKSVSTKDFAQSLTQSLLKDVHLDVKVVGIGVGLPGTISKTVANTLDAAAPSIDLFLDGLLQALGIRLGEADVRVTGVSCGSSVLVQ